MGLDLVESVLPCRFLENLDFVILFCSYELSFFAQIIEDSSAICEWLVKFDVNQAFFVRHFSAARCTLCQASSAFLIPVNSILLPSNVWWSFKNPSIS